MRLPRFRVRTLMVVVALVAIIAGSGKCISRLRRLSESYQLEATVSSTAERLAETELRRTDKWIVKFDSQRAENAKEYDEAIQRATVEQRRETERTRRAFADFSNAEARILLVTRDKRRRAVKYHASRRRKYERAARYPWLPVEPDPPPE